MMYEEHSRELVLRQNAGSDDSSGFDEIIIGIDFGTTYSGCAYIHTGELDSSTPRHAIFASGKLSHTTRLITTWSNGILDANEGKTSKKVPTVIVYEQGKMRWGLEVKPQEARHMWFKLDLDPSQTSNLLGIGNSLHDSRALPPAYNITTAKMVTDFLRALRERVDAHVARFCPEGLLKITRKSYCLTVPAIWSDAAMTLTRACAVSAGMSNISMVTEPEAAAMYAFDALKPTGLKVGSSFVLCDAGGGTVDLISYKIVQLEPVLELKELSPGTGGLCGGVFVNRLFECYLENKFGRDPEWNREILAGAMVWFEDIKRDFTGHGEEVKMVPVGLEDNPRLGIRRGVAKISSEQIRGFFRPIIKEIIQLIKGQIGSIQPEKPEGLILVGGFGDSSYLRTCIRDSLSSTGIRILLPPDAWVAVVKGALMKAMAAKLPELQRVKVMNRVARKYYGTTCNYPYHEGDDTRHRWWDGCDGLYRVIKMDWYVRKGDLVNETDPVLLEYRGTQSAALGRPRTLREPLYYCNDGNGDDEPVYPTERVKKLATLTADVSHIPLSKFPMIVGRDGQDYYELSFKVGAKFFSGYTEYYLYFDGELVDTVKAEFV